MSERQILDYIAEAAEKAANKVIKKLTENGSLVNNNDGEWVETKEAARILGVTPNYLRSIKDDFTHRKVGGKERGRIIFNRAELTNYYLNGRV